MIKFDPYYFQCPSCRAWLEGRNLKSELVNEAILYSDGKVLYDNYITIRQKMIICPSCAHMFWLENPVEPIITTQKPDADIYSWNTWRFYGIGFSNIRGKLALIKHYLVFLEKRNYDAAKEIYLRRLLWWAYNDLHRNHQQISIRYFLNGYMSFNVWRLNRKMLLQGEAFFVKNRSGFTQNLERLVMLLEKHPEEKSDLELPEIYRELRQFDKAKKLLENTQGRTHFTNQILRYCKWKESLVFMVTG